MTLFKAITRGGPVGLVHAVRQAWLARRIRIVSNLMDRERQLHREHMAQLRAELDCLTAASNTAVNDAASHWKALS